MNHQPFQNSKFSSDYQSPMQRKTSAQYQPIKFDKKNDARWRNTSIQKKGNTSLSNNDV